MNGFAIGLALAGVLVFLVDLVAFDIPNDNRHDNQIEALQTQVAQLEAK